jgi:uncharacterized membrane protein
MKKFIMGVFPSREDAEKAIHHLHKELKIDKDEISYVYKNTEGSIEEVPIKEVSSDTPDEGARKGAKVGGTIGALAGIAAVAGFIPPVGPLIASGSLATMLGFTTAVGTTTIGAVTGAAAGGLIGALMNIGIGEEKARRYADRVEAGDILVSVHTDKDADTAKVMTQYGAVDINSYRAVG